MRIDQEPKVLVLPNRWPYNLLLMEHKLDLEVGKNTYGVKTRDWFPFINYTGLVALWTSKDQDRYVVERHGLALKPNKDQIGVVAIATLAKIKNLTIKEQRLWENKLNNLERMDFQTRQLHCTRAGRIGLLFTNIEEYKGDPIKWKNGAVSGFWIEANKLGLELRQK